jgi:hypothetical protein
MRKPENTMRVNRGAAAIIVSALLVQLSLAARSEAKWQSSWAAFVAVLGPEIGPNPHNPGYR